MKIQIVNKSRHKSPQYATKLSAGMDICANIEESITIKPGERALVSTGIFIQLPRGYECQIRPRSGLAFKHGVTVLNSPGTIDADYRGEIGVILINHGQDDFMIEGGDRIAQMVIAKYKQAKWVEVDELQSSERGDGGFGHTGK